jgi:HAD superfamily hydrolase (TIGR01544 family)
MIDFNHNTMKKDENVIIADPEGFGRKKEAICRDGPEKLHVLADFDRTLTYNAANGKTRTSLSAILREEKYLTPDYSKKAHALKDKYQPIEYDLKIPLPEKKQAMEEWWGKALKLLIDSKLNRKDLERAVTSGKVKLRDGFHEFFEILEKNKIPLVIMSATGLGEEAIEIFLKNENISLDNVHIVANSFEWDKEGYMKKAKEPIIHVFNKDETAIQQFPVYERIKSRKNILLLGDGPGDAGMSDGFDAEEILKIGFLNEKVKENLKHYKKLYDVVLLGDPPFDFVVELSKEIINLSS